MFATVVTGSYEASARVTAFGLRQTLLHLAASRTFDQGFYLTVSEAFRCPDRSDDETARRLLNRMLETDEAFLEENGDVSKLLYQSYKRVLRVANFPVLRLEEMVMGPEYWSPQDEEDRRGEDRRGRSHTTERTFNSAASRSRDDDYDEMASGSSRRRRYLRDGLSEVSDPELWQELHHYSSYSTPEDERAGTNGGEVEGEPLRLDGAEAAIVVGEGWAEIAFCRLWCFSFFGCFFSGGFPLFLDGFACLGLVSTAFCSIS